MEFKGDFTVKKIIDYFNSLGDFELPKDTELILCSKDNCYFITETSFADRGFTKTRPQDQIFAKFGEADLMMLRHDTARNRFKLLWAYTSLKPYLFSKKMPEMLRVHSIDSVCEIVKENLQNKVESYINYDGDFLYVTKSITNFNGLIAYKFVFPFMFMFNKNEDSEKNIKKLISGKDDDKYDIDNLDLSFEAASGFDKL